MNAEAKLAELSRRIGILIEAVGLECDPADGGCHEFDLTDDGRCALLADLEELGAVIRS